MYTFFWMPIVFMLSSTLWAVQGAKKVEKTKEPLRQRRNITLAIEVMSQDKRLEELFEDFKDYEKGYSRGELHSAPSKELCDSAYQLQVELEMRKYPVSRNKADITATAHAEEIKKVHYSCCDYMVTGTATTFLIMIFIASVNGIVTFLIT